jgi:hypothetical protein|tara:strand:+ start:155 stop:499 length:345 start_codon:yes stop_codon:yes gene_type:complete
MATITLGNQTLSDSLSIGDIIYHAPITTANGFDQLGTTVKIGNVTGINKDTSVITVTTSLSSVNLVGNFLFFSKNNAVETSGLKGYYATVKMKNTSVHASELYALNSEVAQSSK